MILDQINMHPVQGKAFDDLIPYFDGQETRAEDKLSKDNKAFWEKPDVSSASFRVRLIFSQVTGSYNLVLNGPVSAEVSMIFFVFVCKYCMN